MKGDPALAAARYPGPALDAAAIDLASADCVIDALFGAVELKYIIIVCYINLFQYITKFYKGPKNFLLYKKKDKTLIDKAAID